MVLQIYTYNEQSIIIVIRTIGNEMMAEYHEPTQNSNDHFLDSNDDKNGWVRVCTEIEQNEKLEKNGTAILLLSTLCYIGLNYTVLVHYL